MVRLSANVIEREIPRYFNQMRKFILKTSAALSLSRDALLAPRRFQICRATSCTLPRPPISRTSLIPSPTCRCLLNGGGRFAAKPLLSRRFVVAGFQSKKSASSIIFRSMSFWPGSATLINSVSLGCGPRVIRYIETHDQAEAEHEVDGIRGSCGPRTIEGAQRQRTV